jgi:hypothetical protein
MKKEKNKTNKQLPPEGRYIHTQKIVFVSRCRFETDYRNANVVNKTSLFTYGSCREVPLKKLSQFRSINTQNGSYY